MLYALNLFSDICQLFLNKTGEGERKYGMYVGMYIHVYVYVYMYIHV